MYRRNPVRAVTSGLTGGIILIGLAVAFLSGHFLPVFFIALAIASLLGSIGSLRQNGIYGGLHSFVWLLGLAFCFAFGFWPWILFVVGASIILGALRVPIMAALLGLGIFGLASMANQQPQQAYQPYQQPYQQPQQPYQQGYQEGGQQYQNPPQQSQQGYSEYQQPVQPQYDQPQAQYPKEIPPQEMQ